MNKKAIALILSIIVLITLASISVPILSRSVTESNFVRRYVSSVKSFWISEAGVQRAIRDLNNDPALSSWGDDDSDGNPDITFHLNGGVCRVEVKRGSNPIVDSTGYITGITGASRSVKAKLAPEASHPFSYAGFGRNSLTMMGNCKTDSYDSSEGPYGGSNRGSDGDVGTNGTSAGAIFLGGNAKVNGDAVTGPGGTVRTVGNAKVNGSIDDTSDENMSSVEVPSNLTSLPSGGNYTVMGNDSVTMSKGDYKFSSIRVLGNAKLTLQGPMNIYLTDLSSFFIGGNGKVIVNGQVNIYADGKLVIGGNGVVNNANLPKDFMVYSTYTGSKNGVVVTGNSNLYGVVYAPDTEVKVTGNGDIFGAIVGSKVVLNGNGDVHYDEALKNVSGPGTSGYSVENWKDENPPYKL